MPTNMHVKFENPDLPERGEIEILSWTHGFEQRGPQNLSFTKYLDENSNLLLKFNWSGKQFRKATLSCFRSDGSTDNKPVLYLTVMMEHVLIASLSVSGGGGDVPVETVTLDYGIIQYNYLGQRRDGGVMPKAVAPFRATKAKPASPKKKPASKKKTAPKKKQ